MKTSTLAIAAISLVSQFAAAQPHRHRHVKKEVKRDATTTVVTKVDIVYAMPTKNPEVIVFVNQFGEPLSTMTEGILKYAPSIWSTKHDTPTVSVPSSSSTPVPTTSSSSTLVTVVATPSAAPVAAAPVENVEKVEPTSSSVAPPPPAEPTSAAPPAKSSPSAPSTGAGYGISYSPYNADSSCKTQQQVLTDFATISGEMPLGGAIVRTYGTDCNQVATVLGAAKKYGFQMFAGIYDLTPANLASEVAIITSAAAGDWSNFHTISVGNEAVNDGTFSPGAVVAAIGTVRSLLKTAGFTGSVVTVDTLVAMVSNPELCDNSDYCAANCHPFFDSGTSASEAGNFVKSQMSNLAKVLADKNQKIVITETGWPSRGTANGAAVPSPENQATAVGSLKSAFAGNPENVILFTAFNDMWKTAAAATFNAEQFWGIMGLNPSG